MNSLGRMSTGAHNRKASLRNICRFPSDSRADRRRCALPNRCLFQDRPKLTGKVYPLYTHSLVLKSAFPMTSIKFLINAQPAVFGADLGVANGYCHLMLGSKHLCQTVVHKFQSFGVNSGGIKP